MAEILSGHSEHLKFAPLSHGQTLSICKHLQDQIGKLESHCQKLQDGLSANQGATQGLSARLAKEAARVDGLKEGLGQAQQGLEANRKGLSQANADLHKLQAGLGQSNAAIGALQAGHKSLGTALEGTNREVSHTATALHGLQETVEVAVLAEVARMRDELSGANARLSRLNESTEQLRASAQKARDHIKVLDGSVRGLTDGLAHANSQAGVQQQRLMDQAKGLKEATQKLEDLRQTATRLRDGQQRAEAQIADLRAGTKQLGGELGDARKHLNQTATSLQDAQGVLHRACGDLEATRSGLDMAKAHILDLKANSEMMSGTQGELARKLHHTHAMTRDLRAGLNETNSLVLPNLKLESSLPMGASGARKLKAHSARIPGRGNREDSLAFMHDLHGTV